MIPIKNKKKTLETTINEMRNFSFSYVEKYAPSKQQLKIYLLKKYLKSSIPSVIKKDITDLILHGRAHSRQPAVGMRIEKSSS